MRTIHGLLILLYLSQVVLASTTWYVDGNAAAGGNGSIGSPFKLISDAITAATSGDTISIANATYTGTNNFGSKSLIITAPTGATLTASGGSAFIISGQSGSISGITFANSGLAALSISNSAKVNFTNCNFLNNQASTTAGAALTITSSSTVFVTGSTFSSNVNDAISCTASSINIANSMFRLNTILSSNFGAGISVTTCAVTIDSTTFISNQMAIYATNPSSMSVTNSKFYDNTSPGGFSATTFSVQCIGAPIPVTQSNNKYCGFKGDQVSCFNWNTTFTTQTWNDGCGICEGTNTNRDCAGVCFGSATNCTAPKKIYVAPGGSGTKTGVDANNALSNIQAAITLANSFDTIIAAEGVYNGTGNFNINFQNKTLEITSVHGQPERTFLQCATAASIISSSGITESYDTTITGFTFINCNIGTFALTQSSPTFQACTFMNNINIFNGAAGTLTNSFAVFDGCAFINNVASGDGGAVYITSTSGLISYPTFINSRFQYNKAANGGALRLIATNKMSVINSTFILNSASGSGSSAYMDTLTNVLATGNNFNSNDTTGIHDIVCLGTAIVNQASNTYCGPSGNDISCTVWGTGSLTQSDFCGVCSGGNKSLDCANLCFGRDIHDKNLGCCLFWQQDCNSVCFGTAQPDGFGVCCLGEIDCTGRCNGTSRTDHFGTCCDGNLIDRTNSCCAAINLLDCNNLCNGTAVRDNSTNHICCDKSELDACGICNGTDLCLGCPQPCLNGGSCDFTTKGCNCTGGWYGSNCTTFDCNAVFNCNGGKCTGPNTCNCTGAPGTGPSCSNTACGTIVCQSNSTCIVSNNTCDCSTALPGFFGPTCGNFTCSVPCQHGSTCVGPNLCDCTNSGGFFGNQCGNFSCPTGCNNGGTCGAPNSCACVGGFTGATCDTAPAKSTTGSKNTAFAITDSPTPGFPYWAIIVIVGGAILIVIVVAVVCKRRKKQDKEGFF